MDEIRDFKGVWIPKEIWLNKDLSITEKIYLALYKKYNNSNYVDQSMNLGGISKESIFRIKSKLKSIGLLYRLTNPEDAKKFVIKNSNSGQVCEWCHKESYILEEHHYPIPKSKGGTKTVRICPNCHRAYHAVYGGKNNER
jgi:hypothetical protein